MKKIWINIDPELVDFSYLYQHFEGRCEILAKAVGKDREKYIPLAQNADIIIGGMEPWNEETLEQIKGRVGFIQKFGMGLDNIDLDAAARDGILVANVLGANSASVAEVALLHILNALRKFTPCTAKIKAGAWPPPPQGRELDGKTVGLLGFGNIAKHLARMLSGFQVKILTFDPYVTDVSAFPNVTLVSSREELFEKSDIVSLHIPCIPETRDSINKNLFDLMKPGSYLINTCRGGVIHEADLVEALRSGHLAGAGLDVLAQEPPEKDNPVLTMDNVTITSHMGAETREAIDRSLVIMAQAIDDYLEGKTPKFAQNAKKLQEYGGKNQ